MARALDALGVDIIEAGFPIASPADSDAVKQVAEVIKPIIAAAMRTRRLDIEEAARALEARRTLTHSHVSGDVGSAPRGQAAHDP